MNKDQTLEEIFLAHKPHFDDRDNFMASLTKRLDAVEYIKQHQEATIRRYRLAILVALVTGVISGAIAMAFILSAPTDAPLLSFSIERNGNHLLSVLLLWISENSRLITAAVLSVMMTLGLFSIINNIQDIKTMRSSMERSNYK